MKLTQEQYINQFKEGSSIIKIESKQKEALERAWKNRDFEIELYWKRATYFWSFIAASFAGYFVLMTAETISLQALYIVICLGFIFSLAWYLVNIGSKKWQENWEKHIDMLEDDITGPIYKTVLNQDGYSVSRVNMQVSLFVTIIWFLLGIYFSAEHMTFKGKPADIDLIISSMTLLTIVFSIILISKRTKPPGDNNKKVSEIKSFSFSKRQYIYNNPNKQSESK